MNELSEKSTLLVLNINGLYPKCNNTKVSYLEELLLQKVDNIGVFLTETHLLPEVNDQEIQITGYTLYRKDRLNRSHGGVAAYIRDEINVEIISDFSNSVCEFLSLKIILGSKILLVSILYRPPNTSHDEFLQLLTHIDKIIDFRSWPIHDHILLGDFNFPHLYTMENIDEHGLIPPNPRMTSQERSMIERMEDLLLTQLVNAPTRGTNLLDLVYCNNIEMSHKIEICPTIYSDHSMISVELNLHLADRTENDRFSNGLDDLNLHLADFREMDEVFYSIDWEGLILTDSMDDNFDAFLSALIESIRNWAPPRRTKYISRFKKQRRILWRRRKAILHSLSREPNNETAKNKLLQIESEIKISFESELESEERRAIQKIKENSKYFFSYAKRKRINLKSIKNLKKNNVVTTDPKCISQVLQEQYCSTFSTPKNLEGVPPLPQISTTTLSDFIFTVEDMKEALRSTPSSASPGMDGIIPLILKECCESLARPMYLLWRKSLDLGVVPTKCKISLITPVYKKGARDDAANYRPISLSSHIVKVFERVVKAKIVEHLENNALLNDFQYGFRQGRNCLMQLLDHYEFLLNELSQGNQVDVVYLDYCKAFDRVDHGILLRKLQSLGVVGQVYEWVKSFLTDRYQIVINDGQLSDKRLVSSGVPQGTVLGPLLYLIMVNDMPDVIESCRILSFADDTKLIMPIRQASDQQHFQTDILSICEYAVEDNQLFNMEKFVHLHYTPHGTDPSPHRYSSGDTLIPKEKNTRDLGIVMSDNMTFRAHITDLHTKLTRLMNWVLRTFKTRALLPMKTLWTSFFLPRLDYGSLLTSGSLVSDMNRLEGLQRTFTYRITSINHLDYWRRLQILNLYSIQRRFERYLIINSWNRAEGRIPQLSTKRVTYTNKESRTGRKVIIPSLPNTTHHYRNRIHQSPIYRESRLFNLLPTTLRNFSGSPDVFKFRLDKYLALIPDEPTIPGYTRAANTNSLLDQQAVESQTQASA